MPKSWYSIKAAAEGTEVAEVSIMDYIGAWGVEARTFLAEFRAIKAPTVKVFINSPGGSVFEAIAIFNGMRAAGKTIEVHVLGVAASAASYIAMAGDKIVMPSNTYLFVHNPINAVYGNADEMRDMADILDKIGASLTATYMKRWKGEEQALTDLLAAESYLTAAECLEYGLCDEVTPEITAEAAFDIDALPEALRGPFTRAKQRTEPVVPSTPLAAEIAALALSEGVGDLAAVFATDEAVTDMPTARAAIAQARELKSLCAVVGRAERFEALARARTSLPEARKALAAEMVAEDERSPIDTSKSSKQMQGPTVEAFSPRTIWNDIEAMKAKGRSKQ